MVVHDQLHWRPLYKRWPSRQHLGRRCIYFCQEDFLLFCNSTFISICSHYDYVLIICYKLKTSSSKQSYWQAIQGDVTPKANKILQSSTMTPMKGFPLTFPWELEVREINLLVRVLIWKLNNCNEIKMIDIKSFFMFLFLIACNLEDFKLDFV